MKARAFCHNCGADVALDAPIRIDDFSMIGDGYPLCFKGVPIKLTHDELSLIWSLMKAYPSHVSVSTLLNRIDSDALGNIVRVHVSRIRKRLAEEGVPAVIETVRGRGYRWKPGGGHAVAETLIEGDRPIAEILHLAFDRRPVDRPPE